MPPLNLDRSDIAQFFRPSIDCIVTAILEQKKSAHKTISVSLYISSCKDILFSKPSIFFSISCSWAGLPRTTGYSPKYMNYLLPLE